MFDSSFLAGKLVHLREVRESDAEGAYYEWMNDAEVTRFLEARHFPQSVEDIKEYIETLNNSSNDVFLAIIENDHNAHIGNIRLGGMDWLNRFAEIGLVIDKPYWGRGIGPEAIALVSNYAFNTLGLNKVWAGILAPNVASIRAFEKAGFTVDGVLHRQYLFQGAHVDDIVVAKWNLK